MILDTFLFSEPHETEILLAKLHVESEVVDYWVAVENAFTMKGDAKELHLQEVLSDPRFSPFLDRISVVSLRNAFAFDYRRGIQERLRRRFRRMAAPLHSPSRINALAHDERPYFYAEYKQRAAAFEAIAETASGRGGWVMVTDVDEMVDGTTPNRRHILSRATRGSSSVVQLPTRRFVYDLDNVSLGRVRTVPMLNLNVVSSGWQLGQARKHRDVGVIPTCTPLVYEYSYCFHLDSLQRKLDSFAYSGRSRGVVARALECNHELAIPIKRPQLSFWHEHVDPDEASHPEYILDHWPSLKTGNVNPNYPESRHQQYPEWFPVLPA